MNRLVTHDDFRSYDKFILENNFGRDYPHDLWGKDDVIVKWGGILQYVIANSSPSSVVLDLACGDSPLPVILSGYVKECIGFDKTRLPTYVMPTNCNLEIGTYLEYLGNLSENSIDIMYDSCSVIHFDTTYTDTIYNQGFDTVLDEAERCLVSGGKYIIICDCNEAGATGEFISSANMKELIDNHSTLKLTSEFEITPPENAFMWTPQQDMNVVSFEIEKI